MQKINLVYVNNGAYELYWPSFLEDSCATRLIPGHHFIYYFSLVIRKSKKQDKKKDKNIGAYTLQHKDSVYFLNNTIAETKNFWGKSQVSRSKAKHL